MRYVARMSMRLRSLRSWTSEGTLSFSPGSSGFFSNSMVSRVASAGTAILSFKSALNDLSASSSERSASRTHAQNAVALSSLEAKSKMFFPRVITKILPDGQ